VQADDELEGEVEAARAALDDGRDPLLDEQGRLRLSFTRIDTFENCPRRFRYQYVDGLPQAPAPQLSFGTSVHAALEWLYDRKHPVLPSLDELLQALFDRWETDGFAEVDREQQLEAYQHARDVVTRIHTRLQQDGFRLPAATEVWFELPFPDDVVVVGAIDRVDIDERGGLHVIDYKTSRRARNRSQVRGSLQLSIYALATRELYGELPRSVALDFVVPGLIVDVPVADLDLDGVQRRVADAARRIRAREDVPTPNRLCDWCEVQAVCPAWRGPASPSRGATDDGTAVVATTDDAADEVLGRAVLELGRLGRSVVRDVRRMRQLEAAVSSLRVELDGEDVGPADAPASGVGRAGAPVLADVMDVVAIAEDPGDA
jgi:putative RecB family exonuclease